MTTKTTKERVKDFQTLMGRMSLVAIKDGPDIYVRISGGDREDTETVWTAIQNACAKAQALRPRTPGVEVSGSYAFPKG